MVLRQEGKGLQSLDVPNFQIIFEPLKGSLLDLSMAAVRFTQLESCWSVHAEANNPAAALVSTRPYAESSLRSCHFNQGG
ncbi:hypothetical protein VTI74DRAFT_11079 [Chaetomium olivicolor]